MARFLRLLVGLLCLFLLGCRADATLRVNVNDDGSGNVLVSVALDQEAASRTVLVDNLVLADDLRQGGWNVSAPTTEADGNTWVRASKPFAAIEQIPVIVAEVAGAEGPFRGFSVVEQRSFGKRTWAFRGTVDLRKGLAALSDPELTQVLGTPLGQTVEVLAAQAGGRPIESAVSVAVEVHLPGDLGATNGIIVTPPKQLKKAKSAASASIPSTTVAGAPPAPVLAKPNDSAVSWKLAFAATAPTELQAESKSSRLAPRLWRWGSLAALVFAGVVLLYQAGHLFLESRRDRLRRKARQLRPLPTPGQPQAADGDVLEADTPEPAIRSFGTSSVRTIRPAQAAPARAGTPDNTDSDGARAGALRVLALETAGVLCSVTDPVNEVLIPLARARGCTLSAGQIGDWYVARVMGGLSARDFWTGLGVSGDPVLLDDGFTRRYELNPDVLDFLRQARQRGLDVVAVGDEVAEWTSALRQRFSLDSLIGAWITSGDVGTRPPHPALLSAVLRVSTATSASAMVISRNITLLDAARSQGFRTVHYLPDLASQPGDHAALRSFARASA